MDRNENAGNIKILFTFGGLPHYNNLILSKLNSYDNLEIVCIVPKSGHKTIGNGVKQTKEGINFKVIYSTEKKAWYGQLKLVELKQVIMSEKPHIVVALWPYVLQFVFEPSLYRYIKNNNIKLLLKEIPFDLPKYENTIKYYSSKYARTLNENMITKKFTLKDYVRMQILKYIRKYYYSKILDGVINYVEAYDIYESYGMPKEKIFITTNSVDTDLLFVKRQQAEKMASILPYNPHRIIHIGRLVKWKRVDLLIDAIKIVSEKYPDTELVVIGKGTELENLKQQAKSVGLQDKIIFTGAIYDDAKIGRYLLDSSIYVLAGMGGLSINQAMAFGKPVIVSIADGTEKMLVRENYNGLYFENGNAKDLADKILYLFDNNQLIDKFGKNSEKIIKEEININTVINGYMKAFNTVIKK